MKEDRYDGDYQEKLQQNNRYNDRMDKMTDWMRQQIG